MSNPKLSFAKRRLRITFDIDVQRKGFDRRKFNQDVVRFFAEADAKLKGETVKLLVSEVLK